MVLNVSSTPVSGESSVSLDMEARLEPIAASSTNSRMRRSASSARVSNNGQPVCHTIRVFGPHNIFLHFDTRTPSLNVANAQNHNAICIKMYEITVTDRIHAGDVVILESAENNKYLSGAPTSGSTTSGTVQFISGTGNGLGLTASNDPRLFVISKELGSQSCTIRHKQTGLYLCASNNNSISLSTSENSTSFETYRCHHS
ncbi:uncharacterized protein [Palaemon carinicauda]|uniref:uncharacterized protein n=1 Tax=Palaemon carinicauda TaxID=392227 RepID=UPI0035B57484